MSEATYRNQAFRKILSKKEQETQRNLLRTLVHLVSIRRFAPYMLTEILHKELDADYKRD